MSHASRAPLIKTGTVSQGSQKLALGLAKTLLRSSQTLFARALAFWAKPRGAGHRDVTLLQVRHS